MDNKELKGLLAEAQANDRLKKLLEGLADVSEELTEGEMSKEKALIKLQKKQTEADLAKLKSQEALQTYQDNVEKGVGIPKKSGIPTREAVAVKGSKFTVTFTNKDGEQDSVEVEAGSDESARSKAMEVSGVKPEAILKVEMKQILEPVMKAEQTQKKEGEHTMEKKEFEKQIQESFDSIFAALKRKPLTEELGDAAAKPVATSEVAPKEATPAVTQAEVHAGEQVAQEVKPIVVSEAKKVKEAAPAAKPTATSTAPAKEQTGEIKNEDIIKGQHAQDLKSVVVKEDEQPEAAPAPEMAPAPESNGSTKVEVSATGIEIKIPLPEANPVMPEITPAKEEVLAEAFREVFRVFANRPLVESENGEKEIEIPAEMAAEIKIEKDESGKPVLSIELPVDQVSNEMSPEAEEQLAEAVQAIALVLANKSDLEGVTLSETELGAAAAQPVATSEAPAKEHTPEVTKDQVHAGEQAAQEVKPVVVESKELGAAAAKPVATTEQKPAEHTPEVKQAEVHAGEQKAEEVKAPVIKESELGAAAAQPVATSEAPAKEHTPEVTNKEVHAGEQVAQEVKPIVVSEAKKPEIKAVSSSKPVEHTPKVENKDIAKGQQSETLKVPIIKESELGAAAAQPVATSDAKPVEHTPEVKQSEVHAGEQAAQEVKPIVVSEAIGKYSDEDFAKNELPPGFVTSDKWPKGFKEWMRKDVEEKAKAKGSSGQWNGDDAYQKDIDAFNKSKGIKEEAEVSGSKVTPAEATAVKPVEVINNKGEVTQVAPAAHTEVKAGVVEVKPHELATEQGKEVRGAQHVTESSHQGEPLKAAEIAKGTEAEQVHTEVKAGVVEVKPHDHADAEGKQVRDAAIVQEAKKVEAPHSMKVNTAGSNTVDTKGNISNPAKPVSEPVKASPADVTVPAKKGKKVAYKSLKEAFLLEADYFETETEVTVSPEEKKEKLDGQMALLLARDAKDPMYEELVRSVAMAKKLQQEIVEKYHAQAKEKSGQVIVLKKEEKPGETPASPSDELASVSDEKEAELIREFVLSFTQKTTLNEGVIGDFFAKIKGKALSMVVGFMSDKRLDQIIARAHAQAKSKLGGQPKEVVDQVLAKFPAKVEGDRKAKLSYVRSIINQAPANVIKQAEEKIKSVAASNAGKVQQAQGELKESSLIESIINELFGPEVLTEVKGTLTTLADVGAGAAPAASGAALSATQAAGYSMGAGAAAAGAAPAAAGAAGAGALTIGPGFVKALTALSGPEGIILGVILAVIAAVIAILVGREIARLVGKGVQAVKDYAASKSEYAV